MIRINRETDYGIGILTLMAQAPGERYNATVLAERRGLPQPMVSKILKHLVHGGILVSYRGAKGGYGLARAPQEITIAQVIAALEGPISLTECVEDGRDACQYSDNCTVSTNWNHINRVVHRALESITLTEMSGPEPVAAPPGSQTVATHPLQFNGVRHVSDH